MKVSVVGGATFVGALTEELAPQVIGNPPSIDHVLFDLTITEEFSPPAPAPPGFAVVGVLVFGVSQPDYPGGQIDVQAQFPDEKHIDGLAAGTYTNMRVELTDVFHPLTFEPASFNDIFGTEGSGPNDVIPTGFQLFFNKTGGEDYPLTVYIDNIRVGMSVDGDYNGNGIVDAADYTVWRDNLGLMETATVAEGDGDGDGNVTFDDYTYWKSRFGMTSNGSASLVGGSTAAVPEPAIAWLLLVAIACWRRRPR